MAQLDWGAQDAAPTAYPAASPVNSTALVSWAGAFMSLGLVVGLGIWGFQLAVRDVSGVPVVRALEGPMRVQPEDPGGQAAQHQGLAVNAVQAEGTAAAPADTLTLAPRAAELAEEDTPADASAMVAVEAAPMAEADEVAAATDQAVVAALSDNADDPVAAALALADALSEGAVALTSAPVVPVAAPSAPVPERTAALVPASVPGVKSSPVPQRRPAGLAARAAQIVAEQVAARSAASPATAPVGGAPATQDVEAASLPVGTRLVQLGAFDSAEVARAEWGKLAGRFEDYMQGKSRVIEKAQSGGKTFYRLRAMGFDDLSDARRFCSVLMAGKAACIPVVTR